MTKQEEILERYKQAEKSMNPWEYFSKIRTRYTWNKNDSKMIYKQDLYDNIKEYTLVDILKGKQKVVFDHSIILEEINKHLEEKTEVLDLTITELTDDDNIIAIINDFRFEISLDNEVNKLENLPNKEDPAEGTSPDGKWFIFVKNENLFMQDLKTKEEFQLTFDGEKGNSYGIDFPDAATMVEQGKEDIEVSVFGYWSPNSKYFVTVKIDYKNCAKHHIIQSSPPDGSKPKAFTTIRPCTGDDKVVLGSVCIVDINKKKCQVIDEKPMENTGWGCAIWFNPWFSKENNKCYYIYLGRGDLFQEFKEIDLVSGNSRLIFEKRSDRKLKSHFDNFFKPLLDTNKVLNICDRDGWPHLYLYDLKTGNMEQQLTEGEFGVQEIKYVDEKNKVVYFTAYGREDCNPYYEMLYSVNFDGTNLQLLTPEKQFHEINFSPSFKYFIDVHSTVTKPEKYSLRKSTSGEKIINLKELDITRLIETGWTPVEEFVAKARDGETDIYCNIYRPSNFNPSKNYPIIEYIYASPWAYSVPKSFLTAFDNLFEQVFAELGFIVVTIDGFGTLGRGNEFADLGVYRQVRDSGLPDHVTALKQMADKYSYMDLDRVGIYGVSAGGYDTVNAMLRYPDFYKVGIADAGSHDFKLDPATVHERDSGYPVGDYFDELSNVTNAHKLEGKLLLGHGEVDPVVNPAQTMRLVNALIKANKDFDMLIMPNVDHGAISSDYFLRRMWDYFVTHLLGETPPKEYKIGGE